MVTFIRFQRQLFQRLKVLLLQLTDFSPEHSLRCSRRVNTAGLNGNDRVSTVLEKVVRVERDDTRLIRLSDIGKDAVHHPNEHAVFERMTSVLNDGDDVGAGFGNVDQVTTGPMGEFDSVYRARWPNNVGHV